MTRTGVGYWLRLGLIVLVYLVTGEMGLRVEAVSGFATLVWLPSGISLAAIILWGYKVWPGIFVGALLTNLLHGAPLQVSWGIGVGNTLEAMVGTYMLRRFAYFRNSIDRLQDVMGIIVLGAIGATIISATVGVTSLFLGGLLVRENISRTWLAWWIGDMLSILIVTPLILAWGAVWPPRLRLPRLVEAILIGGLLVYLSLVIFGSVRSLNNTPFPMSFLTFPLLIWSILRFGLKGGMSLLFTLSAIAVGGTVLGFGPFVMENRIVSLLFLQTFMGVTSITILVFGAIETERELLKARKDDFLRMTTHELRQPITGIKAYAHVLIASSGVKTAKTRNIYLKKIDKQANRLTKLVDDLLDISRIEGGRLAIKMGQFDIGELVFEVVDDMRTTFKGQKIIARGKAKVDVIGDKERIGQVLINLISNAVKHSGSNKVIVHYGIEGMSVVVAVQDFGVGIERRYRDRIFDQFFRISDGTVPGMGIGLYISSEIIKAHRERMWIESEVGKGSKFYFSLHKAPQN